MKTLFPALLLTLSALVPAEAQDGPLTLWYNKPAVLWTDALPVGNGRMGAMIYGNPGHEKIQFNEHTVWTGGPHDYSHKGAAKSLPKIRELLWAGKQKEAEDLAMQEFMSEPLHQQAYQAFGDLLLEFPAGEVTGYRRWLDLGSGIAGVEYTQGGVTYRREIFASERPSVILVRLTASKPGSLTFETTLQSAHEGSSVVVRPTGEIAMAGGVRDGAIRFEARMEVSTTGGKRTAKDGKLSIAGADSATLALTGATNFKTYQDVSADPKARNDAEFAAYQGKSFDTLRSEYSKRHLAEMGSVNLELGSTATAKLPTDERIAAFATGNDPALVTLLFQYGRYLMIGSSQNGGQPANLQGLWNDSNKPAWDSKYTDNINTEMNYWPVEETNLSSHQLPLFDAMKDLAKAGAVTAKEQYGARGWVLHHNFDLWRGTAPINASNHGIWQTGGAWLSTHLWEHYLFTGDRKFLAETAYPLMKGAALFFVDALVKDPKTGFLYTGPSNSPEQGGLVMGPTMDREIVRTLFGETISAAKALGTDGDFAAQLEAMRGKIAPLQIGKFGQLQEWMEDTDDPKNQHRHVSHLWAVYPGSEITPYGTPDLFKAARQSLLFRGDTATGWSMGWKVNLWARFLDGDHAYKILQNLLSPAADKAPGIASKPGVFKNLFDAHPPFQIDGNFGATAGITEMLLQSQDPYGTPTSRSPVQAGDSGFLHLLPALPSALATGKVSGLVGRGGFQIAMEWKDGKLVKATIVAKQTKPLKIRYDGREISIAAQAGKSYVVGPDLKVM